MDFDTKMELLHTLAFRTDDTNFCMQCGCEFWEGGQWKRVEDIVTILKIIGLKPEDFDAKLHTAFAWGSFGRCVHPNEFLDLGEALLKKQEEAGES